MKLVELAAAVAVCIAFVTFSGDAEAKKCGKNCQAKCRAAPDSALCIRVAETTNCRPGCQKKCRKGRTPAQAALCYTQWGAINRCGREYAAKQEALFKLGKKVRAC